MLSNPKVVIQPRKRRSRGRPTFEDVVELENRLIRAAGECFLANGYGATSMNDIAKAGGVSKPTLYSKFDSKRELFKAIIDNQYQHAGAVRHLTKKPPTLQAMLYIYSERVLRDTLRPEFIQLHRLLYGEAGRFPEIAEAAWSRNALGVQQLSELIKEYAVKDKIPCRNPERVAETFIALLRGWHSGMIIRSKPVSISEIKEWLRTMLKWFLASRKQW